MLFLLFVNVDALVLMERAMSRDKIHVNDRQVLKCGYYASQTCFCNSKL